MHAKTDSEVTSLAPSSPPRSPRTGANPNHPSGGGGVMRGAVYYVQSPSRDSHDGDTAKTATSVHSTPALSPMASPRHSHSSVGRDSSSSRFSRGHGKDKSAGRKGAPAGKGWQEIGIIEEEGLLDDEDERRPMPKRCKYCLIIEEEGLLDDEDEHRWPAGVKALSSVRLPDRYIERVLCRLHHKHLHSTT